MATTIPQAFQQLRSNLEITGLQSSTVSTRQTNVREVIQAGMDVLDTFLTGSYARSTMIAPLKEADIDMLRRTRCCICSIAAIEQIADKPGFLDLVKHTLLGTYTRTPG